MGAALAYEQPPLFGRPPRRAKPKRRRSPLIRIIERVIGWVQLELALPDPPPPSLGPDADDEFDFPVRRVVPAAEAEPVKTRAVASIFALAASIRRPAGRPAFAASAPAPLQAVAVVRSEGVTRHVGAMYPAGRWTPEKEEAERARRARQRPPKPTAAAKTRGKKVREWDGEAME